MPKPEVWTKQTTLSARFEGIPLVAARLRAMRAGTTVIDQNCLAAHGNVSGSPQMNSHGLLSGQTLASVYARLPERDQLVGVI